MKGTSEFLAKKIYHHLYGDKGFTENSKIFEFYMAEINRKYPQCSDLLSEYRNVENRITFFRYDKEMKIKYPEIWTIQLNEAGEQLKIIAGKLSIFGDENDIPVKEFFENFENEDTKMSGFFKSE